MEVERAERKPSRERSPSNDDSHTPRGELVNRKQGSMDLMFGKAKQEKGHSKWFHDKYEVDDQEFRGRDRSHKSGEENHSHHNNSRGGAR